jgi:hypothetical protein
MPEQIDFIVAGVQKAGTTALDRMLRCHPQIQMASVKETHFFDNEAIHWAGPSYSTYHSHFDWSATPRVRGEATPIYSYWPGSIERIRAYSPNIKLIIILRHPVYRAFSHWRMERSRGWENLAFSDAIRSGRSRFQGAHRVYSYVERGFYARQIERVLSLFSRKDLLFLKTEEIWNHTEDRLHKITSFLGVDGFEAVQREYVVPLASRESEDLREEDRTYLAALFRNDIELSQELTGLDLEPWKHPGYRDPMTP